jgi:hypothetical protein
MSHERTDHGRFEEKIHKNHIEPAPTLVWRVESTVPDVAHSQTPGAPAVEKGSLFGKILQWLLIMIMGQDQSSNKKPKKLSLVALWFSWKWLALLNFQLMI